jgi:hypothetical protein
MARHGSVTFGDLIGKLDTLRVTCDKCGRGGRYSVRRLALTHGRDGRLTDWLAELTKDCPWRQAPGCPTPAECRCRTCSSWRGGGDPEGPDAA